MNDLTIIMYHYVRPIAESDFPGINGLEFDGFIRQLDFRRKLSHSIFRGGSYNCVLKGTNLNKKSCWLTFDDGYKDHHDFVLPELIKRNLSSEHSFPKSCYTRFSNLRRECYSLYIS